MKQGTSPAPAFVCQVLGEAHQLYGKKSQDALDDAKQAEVMTVFMTGFDPRTCTFMILRNVDKLDQVISAAKEPKAMEEPSITDTLVSTVVKDQFETVVMPIMSDMQSGMNEMQATLNAISPKKSTSGSTPPTTPKPSVKFSTPCQSKP